MSKLGFPVGLADEVIKEKVVERRPRPDWAAFVKKLKEIAKPPTDDQHHDIGGEG